MFQVHHGARVVAGTALGSCDKNQGAVTPWAQQLGAAGDFVPAGFDEGLPSFCLPHSPLY